MDDKKIYQIEGFDEEKATREVGPIFNRFYKSYATKPKDVDIQEWLFTRLKEELPNREDSYIKQITNDIVDGVHTFDENLKSIDEYCEKSIDKSCEKWLVNSLEQYSVDMDINEYGNYLAEVDRNLALNNAMAMKAINQGEYLEIKKQENSDWNSYLTDALALNVGKQATLSGVTGLCMEAESYVDSQILNNDDVEVQDFVSNSIESGFDFGLKVATTGAIEVAVENGIFPFLKNTPAGILSCIGSGIVENCKTVWKFIKGEINGDEALDRVGRVATAQVKTAFGICLKREICEKIGETIGTIFGPQGKVVGKIAGNVISAVANTDVGMAIYEGIKKIAKPAVDYAKACWNSIKKNIGKFLDNTRKVVSNGFKKVKSFFS